MPVTAATRLVALLGHPVGHSLSPQLHNAAFAAAGVDATYLAFDVHPERVADAVAAVSALRLLGVNVTIPHKRAVYELVARRTVAAQACGAANTLFWDGDDLVADNTDVSALQEVFRDDVGLQTGDAVLMLGSGGAARAAAVALGSIGARVEVVARRTEGARDIAETATAAGATVARVDRPVLLINATPLGLRGETLPDRFLHLDDRQTALDLVYRPVPTPFLAAAQATGATALDGRGMLIAQAAAAFERWTGRRAPLDTYRRAAHEALAGAPQV